MPPREGFGQTLSGKLGPLPVWVWALIVVGAAYWYIKRKSSSSSSNPTGTNATNLAGVTSPANLTTIAWPMPGNGGDQQFPVGRPRGVNSNNNINTITSQSNNNNSNDSLPVNESSAQPNFLTTIQMLQAEAQAAQSSGQPLPQSAIQQAMRGGLTKEQVQQIVNSSNQTPAVA